MPTSPSRPAPRRPAKPKGKPPGPRLSGRIDRINISNFKAIDALELAFPPPRWPGAPDVSAFGSKNGFGKTSILECCVLGCLSAAVSQDFLRQLFGAFGPFLDPFDLLIRGGAASAEIEVEMTLAGEQVKSELTLSRTKGVVSASSGGTAKSAKFFSLNRQRAERSPRELVGSLMSPLLGMSNDPLLLQGLVYFHSYRKVREGRPDLGSMVDPSGSGRGRFYGPSYPYSDEGAISVFKVEILRSLMGRAQLFESIDSDEAAETYQVLNELLGRYANGRVEKLRPSRDGLIEIRVTPTGGEEGDSFAFDGLSSGQKEAIATTFLVWKYTHQQGGIVLVDEPELHLNTEWHRTFIPEVAKVAPWNQYILATHSDGMLESAAPDNRFLLGPDLPGESGE